MLASSARAQQRSDSVMLLSPSAIADWREGETVIQRSGIGPLGFAEPTPARSRRSRDTRVPTCRTTSAK
jgi:hypothetical protein